MQETQVVEETPVQNPSRPNKRKMQFGHYRVSINEEESFDCKPLTQEELSDGWRAVLPASKRGNPIHHWSVSLAQLPAYLWRDSFIKYDSEGREFIPVIRDGIYHYSINRTEYDNQIIELFNEIQKQKVNRAIVKQLVDELDGKVNGWIMIRAKKLLKDTAYGPLYYR
jgi:hypothetical protein